MKRQPGLRATGGSLLPRPSLLAALALVVLLLGLLPTQAATPGLTTTLRYLGGETFEPTLGVDAQGNLFYSMTPAAGIALGYGTGVWRSTDGGSTWTDVSPRIAGMPTPPETYDPYVYVDPATGRVFQFAMFPLLTCSIMSWSDDDGATWTTNPRGCGATGVWDHQSMVAAAPRGTPTVDYASVLVQCVNAGAGASCARSLDGGFTWTSTAPASWGECLPSGLHGHLKASTDGVIYLPIEPCQTSIVARTRGFWVSVSHDAGLTWAERQVAIHSSQGFSDPTVAIDDAGSVYYAFIDAWGHAMLSVSHDEGRTWSAPVQASPNGVTAHLPALAAGKAGSMVLAYAGTPDMPDGYQSTKAQRDAAKWHAYVTASTDGAATFATAIGNPISDPLVRGPCGPGRCPGMTDFIDVIVAPDGKAHAAFVDACTGTCGTGVNKRNNDSEAVLVTVTSPSFR